MNSFYRYVFTDGLDKLLSTSIWLPRYGGESSLVFYDDSKLKGYVGVDEAKRLSGVGLDLFVNDASRQKYLAKAQSLIRGYSDLPNINKKTNKELDSLISMLKIYSEYLASCYGHYFLTEEFYTSSLDPDQHKGIIEEVGKARFELIDYCVKATEVVHDLGSLIGKSYDYKPDDVFFMTIEEVLGLVDGLLDISVINERRDNFLLVQSKGDLSLISGVKASEQFTMLVDESVPDSATKTIKGMVASSGRVQGEAYVISLADPEFEERVIGMPDGAILVTESTQPSMLLACQKAAGIVTDEGGVLSHAAIIAREFGIPCVVGTRCATELIEDGQSIIIDGNKGEVKL